MKKKVFSGIFLLIIAVGLCAYLTNKKSENYNITTETSEQNEKADTGTVVAHSINKDYIPVSKFIESKYLDFENSVLFF